MSRWPVEEWPTTPPRRPRLQRAARIATLVLAAVGALALTVFGIWATSVSVS